MFQIGDAVFHPIRGAGIVRGVEERQWRGGNDWYYTIELLGQPSTRLMIPTCVAEERGLRPAISRAKLEKVWRVLRAAPEKLPIDHRARHRVLEEKVHAGDVFELAGAVRDMAWRQEQKGRLTIRGKRIYDEGMTLLAGEIAAAQGIELTEAEAQVRAKLRERLAPATVM
jgi:CarD family transcriptional regulator